MPELSECTTLSHSRKLKVAEGGRQAVFHNARGDQFRLIKADGCLFINIPSADFIVCGPPGDLIVELKGTDVGHALDQVKATLTTWKREAVASEHIAALIVCSRVPRFDSKIQRVKLTLRREFQAKLHISSRNQEHDFESLF